MILEKCSNEQCTPYNVRINAVVYHIGLNSVEVTHVNIEDSELRVKFSLLVYDKHVQSNGGEHAVVLAVLRRLIITNLTLPHDTSSDIEGRSSCLFTTMYSVP